MGHRHHPNSFRMPMNRGHDGSHSTAHLPHNKPYGRAPEIGSLPHLPDNVSKGGGSSSLQWGSGSSTHEHPSRYGMQIPQFQPDHSASSYDPFSISSASTNFHLIPQDDGGFGNSYYNERSGLQDSLRRGIKRKSPDNSTVCERGSSSRISGAGSSSNSEPPFPTPGYQNSSSDHVGLPYCAGGGVVINGEDPMLNVRSSSRLDLETYTSNCLSSYSSYNYHPTPNPSGHFGAGGHTNTNVNETNRVWTLELQFLPASDGRAQISGKLSVEGKVHNIFDINLQSENIEDYGKLCHERTNRYMTKTRQVLQEKKKVPVKSSDMKRTRRDRGEMEHIMFKLFEREPNWTLKKLLHETDQPEQFLKDLLKDLCVYNNKGANQGTYELKPEYKKSVDDSAATM